MVIRITSTGTIRVGNVLVDFSNYSTNFLNDSDNLVLYCKLTKRNNIWTKYVWIDDRHVHIKHKRGFCEDVVYDDNWTQIHYQDSTGYWEKRVLMPNGIYNFTWGDNS